MSTENYRTAGLLCDGCCYMHLEYSDPSAKKISAPAALQYGENVAWKQLYKLVTTVIGQCWEKDERTNGPSKQPLNNVEWLKT